MHSESGDGICDLFSWPNVETVAQLWDRGPKALSVFLFVLRVAVLRYTSNPFIPCYFYHMVSKAPK